MASALKSKSPTIRRILREAHELSSTPSPDYTAVPLESDLFEWHFTLRGPPSSPYSEGIYHGRITLPPSYPLKPPNFRFVTPNGRFETNREICLSISGHHEETWQPAWGVRTALVALRSFMETSPDGQLGGLATTEERRRILAKESKGYKCGVCRKSNAEIMEECEERARKHEAEHGTGATKEVEVPEELSLGFKDEMEKNAKDASTASASRSNSAAQQPPAGITSLPAAAPAPAATSPGASPPATTGAVPRIVARTDSMDSETAALAEGFVPTIATTTSTAGRVTGAQTQGEGEVYLRPRPAQGVPQPTGAASRYGTLHAPQAQVVRPGQGADGVPVWVDKAIMLVISMLVMMLLKVLFY